MSNPPDLKKCPDMSESMITYKSKKYSVPIYLIGKNVTVKEYDFEIYIYYTTNFVCSYNIDKSLRFNYKIHIIKIY